MDLSPLESRVQTLEKALDSFEIWQKRSWFKRTFYRWRPPGEKPLKKGLLGRLLHSIHKRVRISKHSDVKLGEWACKIYSVYPEKVARKNGLFDRLIVGCRGLMPDGWCQKSVQFCFGPSKPGDVLHITWSGIAGGPPIELEVQISGETPARFTISHGKTVTDVTLTQAHQQTEVLLCFSAISRISPDDARECSGLLHEAEIVHKDAIETLPSVSTWVFPYIRFILTFLAKISKKSGRHLSSLADCLADRGEYENARWLYDRIWKSDRSNPSNLEQVRNYFLQYEGLGERLYVAGRLEEAIKVYVQRRALQHRLAIQNGLDPAKKAYLVPAWTGAIGHIATIAWIIQYNIMSGRDQKLVVIPDKVRMQNRPLLNYYSPWLKVDDSDETTRSLETLLLSYQLFAYGNNDYMEIRQRWSAQGRPPLLKLSDDDRARGRTLLEQLGMDPKGWFVCLHVRSAEGTDGDRTSRNARLDTYADAIRMISAAGGQVIRIGPKLTPPSTIPGLIDYASSPFRTEWGDVFICAGCRFFLGTNSGPIFVPEPFGVPVVATNWHPMGEGAMSGIYIPKLLWHEAENRFLTLSETLKPPFYSTQSSTVLRQHGVKLINNTSEEIGDLIQEVLKGLDGPISYTFEQERDQETFRKRMRTLQPHFHARLGAQFLAQHPELLR